MKNAFIAISTILIFTAPISYIRNILKNKTKPKVVTWFNWGILAFIAGSASLTDKQYAAAVMSFSAFLLCITISLIGWRRGDKHFDKLDYFSQLGIFISLLLWWLYNSPSLAIIAVIIIDFIALVPTLKHSWESPHEETALLFFMSSLAATFTILAAQSYRITSIANPAYLVCVDLATGLIIINRSKKLNK